MRLRYKNKKNIIGILVIVCVVITIIFIKNKFKYESYSQKIIHISELNGENKLSEKQLNEYRAGIHKEIEGEDSKINLKKSYFALGVIDLEEKRNEESIENLSKALTYKGKRIDKVDLMIISALSTNNLIIGKEDESQKLFLYAKEIALSNNMNDQLSNIYYARAKAVLNSKANIEAGIKLLLESKEIECSSKNKIDTYLFLASLYRLNNEYDSSLKYTTYALDLSIKIKDKSKINSSIINLGENYYMQSEHEKAIYIYEGLLRYNEIEDIVNRLTITGYLLVSHSEVGNYKQASVYKDEYLELVNNLNEDDRNTELIWLYMVYSNMKVKEGHIDKAKDYLYKAENLYTHNKLGAYINTDLYLESVKILINYNVNKNYNNSLEEYESLLCKLDDRGIKSDLMNSAIKEIIKISYENNDYNTTLKYIKALNSIASISNVDIKTDNAFEKLKSGTYEKQLYISNLYSKMVFGAFIFTVITLMLIFSNNKKVNKMNLELKEISRIDSLTKVYNKRYMYEVINKLCKSNSNIIFIMIDIDYFKLYNDNYGHIKGDDVIVKVATIMKNTFNGDLVFRYGGEEFSIISRLPKEEVILKIEKLRNALYEANISHEFSEVSYRLTLSIGMEGGNISSMEDVEKIISCADRNLYRSKRSGRNMFTC